MFVPPPMDGTISLGIFDAAGKLIRTLEREAKPEDLIEELDGLAVDWDGTTDDGKPAAPGQYRARGWVVGNWEITGDAFLGNDWIESEDSPRVGRIDQLLGFKDGALFLQSGETILQATADQLTVVAQEAAPTIPDPSTGQAGEQWSIANHAPTGIEVRAISHDALQRRLTIAAGEPQPTQVVAAPDREQIALLESRGAGQRVRVLSLAQPADANAAHAESTWKVDWTRAITPVTDLAGARALLTAEKNEPLPDGKPVTMNLVRNELAPTADAPTTALLTLITKDGCFLASADGLPLRQISDTTGLKWAAVARATNSKKLLVWQSDGLVVEQFSIGGVAQMMAFDAGDFDWPPAKAAAPAK